MPPDRFPTPPATVVPLPSLPRSVAGETEGIAQAWPRPGAPVQAGRAGVSAGPVRKSFSRAGDHPFTRAGLEATAGITLPL